MFNPKLSDFAEQNPEITVIGLYWAGYWRLMVVVGGIALGLSILGEIVG